MRCIVRWFGLSQADKADSHQSVKRVAMGRSFQKLVGVFTLSQNIPIKGSAIKAIKEDQGVGSRGDPLNG